MRRITILCMALAMSAFAFSSCAYQDWEPEPSKGGSDGNGSGLVIPAVTDFSVYASIAQTKSVVTEEGALAWTAGDLINVFHGVAGEAELVSDGVVFLGSCMNTTGLTTELVLEAGTAHSYLVPG